MIKEEQLCLPKTYKSDKFSERILGSTPWTNLGPKLGHSKEISNKKR